MSLVMVLFYTKDKFTNDKLVAEHTHLGRIE